MATEGLASPPCVFQKRMEFLFSGLSHEVEVVYLDDNMVRGKTIENRLKRLDQVCAQIEKSGLKIKGTDYAFVLKEIPFLGSTNSEEIVKVEH